MKLRLLCFILLLGFSLYGHAFQDITAYKQYLDSAASYVDSDPILSKTYIDSIDNPSEEKLGSRTGEYFYLKAILEKEDYDTAGSIQHFIRSLKFAEKFKDYRTAARSSGELASKFYLLNKDSLADVYFEKAKGHYTRIGDELGLLDLMQFPAYAKYVNFEMEESIALISKDLEIYRNVEEDQAFYCFAIFLLSTNYLHLGNIEKAHEYHAIYKSLEGNEYIEPTYYLNYSNAIKSCYAEYYFEHKNLDSIKYYLDGIHLKSGSKDFNVQKSLYNNYVAFYKLTGETEKEKLYLDSLDIFNNRILENSVESSLDGIEDLSEANLELVDELSKKRKNRNFIYVLIGGVVVLFILLLVYLKKVKKKQFIVSDLTSNFSRFKAKQEKLVVKNIELEEFINSMRKEIKRISSIHSLSEQKISINRLYKDIHINHSNFVNSEDHFKLISAINEDFFLSMEKEYPQLDNLEVLICYYLFTDFKNKEIAIFVDRSIRAIENKRYRITKKLNIDSNKETLKEFLDRSFKDNSISNPETINKKGM